LQFYQQIILYWVITTTVPTNFSTSSSLAA
jgi:hypothetical protein